jgi:hypothetical protein
MFGEPALCRMQPPVRPGSITSGSRATPPASTTYYYAVAEFASLGGGGVMT